MDSLIEKINDVEIITESQQSRLDMAILVQENLINFVNIQIEKLSNKDSLLSAALQAAGDKLQQDIEDGTLTWPALLKIIELSSRSQNEIVLGLFDIIKCSQKAVPPTTPQNANGNKNPDEKTPEISNENYAKIKQFVDLFSKVKDSEFVKK